MFIKYEAERSAHSALLARFPVIVRSKWNLETITMTDAEP